jgi:hypothetical protein
MSNDRVAKTIADFEAAIAFMREKADDTLIAVEKANPTLSETELFQKYEAEVRVGLSSVSLGVVSLAAERSFLELRRGRSGYNRDHLGGG